MNRYTSNRTPPASSTSASAARCTFAHLTAHGSAIAAVTLLLLSTVRCPHAAEQWLGGTPSEGKLKLSVRDDGSMTVERYMSGDGWQSQIDGGNAKGSRLQWPGNAYGLGYCPGAAPTLTSNRQSGDTITTVFDCGELTCCQQAIYSDAAGYITYVWTIRNQGSCALSHLQFFHATNSALDGTTNGAGFYDASRRRCGVQKQSASGGLSRMALEGLSTPYAHESGPADSLLRHVNAGALDNKIDPHESSDNAYGLEWRCASLQAGAKWTVYAREAFFSVEEDVIVVYPPAPITLPSADPVPLAFSVRNTDACCRTVWLTLNTDRADWGIEVGGTTAALSIGAGCLIPVSVVLTPPAGALAGRQVTATLTAAGSDFYGSGSVAATLPGEAQTIAFDTLAPRTYGDPPFTLNAASSSGLPVCYASSDTSVATLRNDTVVILGAGTTAITASQAGDTEYCPAPSVARTLVVERSAQTIQFAELPSRTLGDPPLWLWALATSRLPVSFTSSDTSVAAVCDGNMLYIVGAGTALISAEQHGDQNYAPAQPVAHALIVAPCPLPPAPVLDSSSVQLVVRADTVILRWYGSGSQAQRYRLVVSDPSLPVGTFHQDSSLVDTQAVVHGLLDGATYHWYVQAGNSSGWGEPSAIGMLNVQLDRVALLDASRTVRLAPHVVGARCIRYGLPVQTKVRIALLDVQGRTVWSVCKRQSPGVYTLHLRNGSVASGRYALHFSAGTYTAKRTISIAQ